MGFSVARGNSQTENLALAVNAVHPTLNDKITIYLSSIDTQNDLATPSTVANLIQAGLRYDRNLAPKVFAFGAADFMSNALQFLDLRQVYTGGFGYHAIKSDATTLDFLGGINYTHETYSNGTLLDAGPPPTFTSYGVTNRFVALTLGEELNTKLGKSTVLTQSLGFLPRFAANWAISRNFQLGNSHEDQQMVWVAEPVWRHLRLQPANWLEEKRSHSHDWPEHLVYSLRVTEVIGPVSRISCEKWGLFHFRSRRLFAKIAQDIEKSQ